MEIYLWTILSVGSVYIYIWFSAFSMLYFIRWRMNINKINNFISIYSSKKEPSLVSLVCWNILSVGFMYIYIYRFSAPSMDYWLLYPTKNELLTFQLVNLGDLLELHILSMKPQKNCFIKKWKNLLRFLSAWWVGDVEGMVLEEFQNIMLSVYIFVEFFFLNGFQKSTDRIFRLECQLCWLPVVTFYKYHILGKHWHKP